MENPIPRFLTQPELFQFEADDVTQLTRALQEHDRSRHPQGITAYDNRQMQILQATCHTLLVGPPELGVEVSPSPWHDQVYAVLGEVGADDLPEAQMCRLWLAGVTGEKEESAVEKLASLVKASLWEPVQALAYRALAYYGRRELLADLLPREGALSLVQADAWLEASHPGELDAHWVDRIVTRTNNLLPSVVCAQWVALFKAETKLAHHPQLQAVEGDLNALASLASKNSPRNYEEVETQHLAARAAVALARVRLAACRHNEDIMTILSGYSLPTWERAYLRALALWQQNDLTAAAASLETAQRHNPHQTCIRLAQATLLAAQSPPAALQALEHQAPTREMLVCRAVLLARSGRYDEAEATLKKCEVTPAVGNEAIRYNWARGRQQFRQQENMLRMALAEWRGDWNTASKIWGAVGIAYPSQTLQGARQLFAAQQELRSLPAAQSWRRSVLDQRIERGHHEIGSIPLIGEALFLRAVAELESFPQRAAKDFQTLLRQRAWVEAERRVGGGRIIFAGDTLLRLGYAGEAIRAYELVSASPQAEVKTRLAVALVYAAIMRQAGPETILSAADRAADLVPADPWPQLLAALGLLMTRESDAARLRLEEAEKRGAPELVCRCLRSMCHVVSGTMAAISDEELAALRLPKEAEAIIRLLCGAGSERERLQVFVRAVGDQWTTQCPMDPHLTARRLLAAWCDEENWDEAMKFAEALKLSNLPWAAELATVVRLRHVLGRALRGELEEAERELRHLEMTPSLKIV